MKATEANFLEFLRKSPQFEIPIYQRTYSWTERDCRQLWEDILRTGRDDTIPAHFVGSIVYIERGLSQVSHRSPLLVIDGQQRLTTVTLILEALARRLSERGPVHGFSAKKLRHYYLLNPLEDGEGRYKLLLTQTDKDSLLTLIQQKPQPLHPSISISDNFAFFVKQVTALGDDLVDICKGLVKLMVVDIALSRDHDNPQLIFESMNSTGRELTQADLIRNFLLMGLDSEQQKKLYDEYWRPMEVVFGQEAYGRHFDGFMRHYLTLKTGVIPKLRAVYEAFKRHVRTPEVMNTGVELLVADVHEYAKYYCAMVLGKEPNKGLAEAFGDLRELKVDVTVPLLLELYKDYDQGLLPRYDFIDAVRVIEVYLFRRAVCSIPTNSHNKTFATFRRSLEKEVYLESLKSHFLSMQSYRRFPRDLEFVDSLKKRDLYNFYRRSYWLRRLENHDRKEIVSVGEYTIEHILPQNKNLSVEWQTELGPAWQRIQETWVHTLGNLTLTGYNAEYSDHVFAKKRDIYGGFRESPLRLNEGLAAIQTWNEDAIKERAHRLAKKALQVWALPSVDVVALEAVRVKDSDTAYYTLDSHPHLNQGSPMRPLFDTFRKAVLALDPCVREEVLKLYVAYKAETNFVDVVPQKERLRLSLNMAFHELYDPRSVAKDVTNVGRWGNGDVEIGLSRSEDVSYVMGLVRQSFEKQMDNGEIEG